MVLRTLFSIAASIAISMLPQVAFAEEQVIVIDAVAASVDGKPITLRDVSKRLVPARELTLKDIVSDPEAKTALETLIFERLILQEAESRKLGVSNSEIDEYINEVAARNNLSREDFEAALVAEKKSIDDYKNVLKIDILKSKLTSNYVRSAVSVTEEEIDKYIAENSQYSDDGSKLKLSQILLRADKHSEEEAMQILSEVLAKFKEGQSFSSLAKEFSEGSQASEGGSLGLVAEKDLSTEIFDAVFPLKTGEISEVTKTSAGFHLFYVDERIDAKSKNDDDDSEEDSNSQPDPVREEVRKLLNDQKMQEKMSSFFTSEIYKLHTVDRKI